MQRFQDLGQQKAEEILLFKQDSCKIVLY